MNNFEDIPVIQRAAAQAPAPTVRKKPPAALLAGALLLPVAAGGFFALRQVSAPASTPPPTGATLTTASRPAPPAEATLLGHYRYREAKRDALVSVAGGGHSALVLRDVLPQYQQMVRSARADGVFLVPLSGFRSERYQEELYTRQLGKAGTADTATLINAPPGYSEHHTGYALDFGDGNQPGTHTQLSFERTAAFRWLKTHAGRFGFEMSFPPGNAQKVSYEPWHWRYVGDREALEVFYKARSGT